MAPRHSWQIESVATDQTINTPSNQTVVGVYVYFVTGQGNHRAVFLSNDSLLVGAHSLAHLFRG